LTEGPFCKPCNLVLSTPSFWEWVAPSTTITRRSEPFKELRLDPQRVKELASKLHVHSVINAARHVHTRRTLSSTIVIKSYMNSHQPGDGFRSSLQPS
jgi:hypothetical protein